MAIDETEIESLQNPPYRELAYLRPPKPGRGLRGRSEGVKTGMGGEGESIRLQTTTLENLSPYAPNGGHSDTFGRHRESVEHLGPPEGDSLPTQE